MTYYVSYSNDTLATVVANVTSGCGSDLNAGVPETITQIVQEVYPTARSIMCLKECVPCYISDAFILIFGDQHLLEPALRDGNFDEPSGYRRKAVFHGSEHRHGFH